MLEQQKPLFTLRVTALGDGNTVLAASFLHSLADGTCWSTSVGMHETCKQSLCMCLAAKRAGILQLCNMQGVQTAVGSI